MRNKTLSVLGVAACLLLTLSFEARGESSKPLPLDSLLGKFAGVIQVENLAPVPHGYQTEITAVDVAGNTVTLSATCLDCGTKRWVRSKCGIQEISDRIRFICKGPTSDEEYIFDGKKMTATGFGNKFPYSIHVAKI
jgi:hypothetical protein